MTRLHTSRHVFRRSDGQGAAGCSRAGRRLTCVTRAQLTNKGTKYDVATVKLKGKMGEGSFGQVFEGLLYTGGEERRVVMKRVKPRVEGAAELIQMEHVLNVYASKEAEGSCAPFVGYLDVKEEDSSLYVLTPGTWLMWDYEGRLTLAYYLKRRDCIDVLSRDLGVPPRAVVATVISQILESVAAFHAAGLVHRDVKPGNIIFAEDLRRFKLIDLGACCDLRMGTNFVPDESILDPTYSAPEQYVLPTDTPDLGKRPPAMSLMMSPMLWMKHGPDRFDMYSVGLLIMELSIPQLRGTANLSRFNSALKACSYNLQRWRVTSGIGAKAFWALDAEDGAGWELVQMLLRERKVIKEEESGHVLFAEPAVLRPSAKEALKHRFFQQAVKVDPDAPRDAAGYGHVDEAGVPVEGEQAVTGPVRFWRSISDRLLHLEAQITATASDTSKQTNLVQQLKEQVEAGEAKQQELEDAQSVLTTLMNRLGLLQRDLKSTAAEARGFLSDGKPAESSDKRGTGSERRLGSERRPKPAKVQTKKTRSKAEQEQAPERSKLALSADRLIRAGLRSVAGASRLASRVVDGLSQDAERFLRENDEEARRKAREQESAFLQVLEQLEPEVEVGDSWDVVSQRIRNTQEYRMVGPERRVRMYEGFQEALAVRQRNVRRKRFTDTLALAELPHSTTYDETARMLDGNSGFMGVEDEEQRRSLFQAFMAKRETELPTRLARQAAEDALRYQLQEVDPPLTPASTWSTVNASLPEPRAFAILSEEQQAQVFEEELRKVLVSRVAAQPPPQLPAPPLPASPPAPAPASYLDEGGLSISESVLETGQLLDRLRMEQRRLQQEYAKMEKRLQQMEEQLQLKDQQLSGMTSAASDVEPLPAAAAASSASRTNGAAPAYKAAASSKSDAT